MDAFEEARNLMVDRQIRARGINDTRVLNAMARVPRHLFVDPVDQPIAYEDRPLPIGHGQTISQPYIVALMCEALQVHDECKVLDVGTGSGYAAAILSELGGDVVSLERIPELTQFARANLNTAGYEKVVLHCADGTLGYPDNAPYDAIMVAAGAPVTPEHLKRQLAIGGRLVIPVGSARHLQTLVRITRVDDDDFATRTLGEVCFVPLIGEEGWTSGE